MLDICVSQRFGCLLVKKHTIWSALLIPSSIRLTILVRRLLMMVVVRWLRVATTIVSIISTVSRHRPDEVSIYV